jgi:hypothetical protein
LDAAIAKQFSPAYQQQALLKMGRASADDGLAGPYKMYVHPSDPHQLLKRSPQLYKLYYSVGYRTYEKLSEKSAVLRTFDAEDIDANDCVTVAGWYQRAIELCGGVNVRIAEPRCRARQDSYCEYLCIWS